LVLLIIVVVVLGVDAFQRRQAVVPQGTSTPLPAGSIPIYLDGQLVGGFVPADLEKLQQVSFVDAAEQKSQDGWLLSDVILLYVDPAKLSVGSKVVVYSTSRGKSIELTWSEIQEPANMVMFDLSNRGTLKLVSLLPRLDTRDEWVQDVDKIEIVQ
jgi:hypothetical protein